MRLENAADSARKLGGSSAVIGGRSNRLSTSCPSLNNQESLDNASAANNGNYAAPDRRNANSEYGSTPVTTGAGGGRAGRKKMAQGPGGGGVAGQEGKHRSKRSGRQRRWEYEKNILVANIYTRL